jgi:hypothetical protein
MKQLLIAASVASFLAMGCHQSVMQPNVAASDVEASAVESESASAELKPVEVVLPSADDEVAKAPTSSFRAVGDYVVYRFHGAYRKGSVELSQRVVSRDGDTMMVDMTLTDGDDVKELRLRFSDKEETRGKLLSVAKVVDGVQKPFGIRAYEQLMSATVLSADDNLESIGTRSLTLTIGKQQLDVTKHAYRVRVGKFDGVMYTLAAEGFPWGDVGGEIRADDGTLLYKAEIVEIGGDKGAQLAAQSDAETYDDYDDFED